MNIIEFGQMITKELHQIGYEFCEAPDLVIDLIEELYNGIIGDHPEAILTLTKEFDRGIAFYFKRGPVDRDYDLHQMCVSIGFQKEGWLRAIPRVESKPENLRPMIGKVKWIIGC